MPNTIDRGVLIRRWVHAHEEDTADSMVYRPDNYPFPPSRGRRSFELRPDGSMIDHKLAPDDRGQTKAGAWDLKGGNVLELRPDNGDGAASSTFLIEQAHPDKLVISRTP